jgi:hypothetical protein
LILPLVNSMPVLRRPVETAPFSGNVDLQFHQRKLSMSDSNSTIEIDCFLDGSPELFAAVSHRTHSL